MGYRVIGMVRRSSTTAFERIAHIRDRLEFVSADLLDQHSLVDAVREYQPDEIYNLAAQSFVGTSWTQPVLTGEFTALGVTRMLEAAKKAAPHARFYQASSSEMFGKVVETPQRETTPFYPRSPYGVAKVYGHWITVNYRESYGVHASSGILFNHESPIRGETFVTRKVTMAAARIREGQQDKLYLGNLHARRDWGFAGDYVEGMWRMVQQDTPDDYVLATGKKHTVRQLIETAAAAVDIAIDWQGEGQATEGRDRRTGRLMVRVNPDFYRPADLNLTVGNAAKAAARLGWKASLGFEALIRTMIQADIARLKTGQMI